MPVAKGTRAVAAALRIAAAEGWRAATLDRIADEAGITLEELQDMFPSRAALLDAFIADIDHDMLGRAEESNSDGSARDRLFDVVMARYDALRPYRDAFNAIARGALRDPVTAWTLAWTTRRSAEWILAAAGVGHTGIEGEVKIQCIGALLATTLPTFARDETEDMASTMAAVDRAIRTLERAQDWLRRVPRSATASARRRR
jgi:AcrR family transcriptional regulator